MNLSGISNKTPLGRMLRLPLKLIPPNTVVPILQGGLKGKRWISGSCDHGCWLGSYEHEKQRLFAEHVSNGAVVFDIGANVGFYTLLASTLVGNGKVVAFEPVPGNLRHLRRHLSLNKVQNVTVVESAVSDEEGTVLFKRGASNTNGSIDANGDFQVTAVSIDRLISTHEVPIPSLIKMDIEGGEFRALIGARATLMEYHPTIFLATHGAEIHRNCCEFLRSLGYNLRPVIGDDVDATDEIIASRKNS